MALLLTIFIVFHLIAMQINGQYNYSHFSLEFQEVTREEEDISTEYLTPAFALPRFKTLEEIDDPPDLLLGRFHGFVNLLTVEMSKLRPMRRALANVIHYLYGAPFLRLVDSKLENMTEKPEAVSMWWRYFYHCITTYDMTVHYGPCSDGFVNKRKTEENEESYVYDFLLDWVPERDLKLLPMGHDMLLILFNLALCQHFHNNLQFICPSPCLGIIDKDVSALESKLAKPGNPCASVRNTRTPRCVSRRIWSVYIHQLFSELVEPKNWDRIPGPHYLNWLKEEGGYVCDCEDGYQWMDTSFKCERITGWVDQCERGDNQLGPCDKDGTYQCSTDQQSGIAFCDCNPGYFGKRCKDRLDACQLKLVSYSVKDLTTGKMIRKLASGHELCNTNMSGIALPQIPDGDTEGDKFRSQCIPTLGTNSYRCKCKPPFSEDTEIMVPNCLKQSGPCDNRLCIHGTCVTSTAENATSICVCDPGYDGEMCENKVHHWSVWSECLPLCGFNRTRTRRRASSNNYPSMWEPGFQELAEIPNDMTDKELHTYSSELVQVEVCPPRTGTQCPFSPGSRDHASTIVIDPGLLELQSFLSLSTAILLFAIGFSACVARVIRESKY